MYKFFLPVLALILSSCEKSGTYKTFFVDSVGHSALFFNEEINRYSYSIVGGNVDLKDDIIRCSDRKTLCMSGPFYLKIDRDRLSSNPTEITSSDGEKTCTFRLSQDQAGELGIEGFRCEYRNGAPSPTYRAVRIGDEGEMESSVLAFSRL